MFQTSGKARYPSLLDRCIYIMIAYQKGCHTASKKSKNISPQYLGGILGENLWYLLIAFPLVSIYNQPDTILVEQYPSSKPAEGGQWVSLAHMAVLKYNWYNIPLLPWAGLLDEISDLSFIPLSSNLTVGSWGFGKSLREGIGIPFKSSEYVIL